MLPRIWSATKGRPSSEWRETWSSKASMGRMQFLERYQGTLCQAERGRRKRGRETHRRILCSGDTLQLRSRLLHQIGFVLLGRSWKGSDDWLRDLLEQLGGGRFALPPLEDESLNPGIGVVVLNDGAERQLEVNDGSEMEELPDDLFSRHRCGRRKRERKKVT